MPRQFSMSATGTGVYLVHAFFMIDLLMIDRKHFVPFVLFFSSLPCLLFVDCSKFLIMLCTSRLVYSPSDLPVSSVLVYTRADLYYLLPTIYSPIIWNISYLFIICLFVRKLCS